MFDARKLLDALVGAASQWGQGSGRPSDAAGGAGAQTIGTDAIAGQVDQTLRQVTGQGTGELVQKAKDVMAQNPALAPAVMVGLAGLFASRRRAGGVHGGGLVRLGGLALIGTLAYKAYQNRQAGKPLLDTGGLAGSVKDALGGLTHGQAGGGQQPDTASAAAPNAPSNAAGNQQMPAAGATATASQGLDSLDMPKDSHFHPVSQTEDDALLYLRAMVAAASADGRVDDAERSRIIKGLTEAGIDPEATRWLEREMASPADVEELSAPVNTPEKAAQVYAAARIAIDPDTMQEREFLNQLAEALDLDQATRAQIDETAGARA